MRIRLGTIAFCTAVTIFKVGQVSNCQALQYVISASHMFGVPATSLLFYFRVRAIWCNSNIITVVFGLLWLGILGSSGLAVFNLRGAHLGMSHRCISASLPPYSSSLIFNAVNDTLIFFAISWRIATLGFAGTKLMSFVRGDGLPRLSKIILQSGQLYYFATIGLSIVTVAMYRLSVPLVYRTILFVATLALKNAMACRVFRAVKLGLITSDGSSHEIRVTSSLRFRPGHDITQDGSTFDSPGNSQVNV